jgi:hypothetical protein
LATRFSSGSDRAAVEEREEAPVVADEDERGARLPADLEEQLEEAGPAVASSEEVGSSAMTSSGAPIRARAAATRCC